MNTHPSHSMTVQPPNLQAPGEPYCAHCGTFHPIALEHPCPMVNAPSGLPQLTGNPRTLEEYTAFVTASRLAHEAEEETQDRHDEALVWLCHAARAYARIKPHRRIHREQFKHCAAQLSRAASEYTKTCENY